MDQKLRSIINYPKVSASVHQYNKEQFINWKQSIGQNYSNVIANLRWHQDWLKEPMKYESAIDQWLKTHTIQTKFEQKYGKQANLVQFIKTTASVSIYIHIQ